MDGHKSNHSSDFEKHFVLGVYALNLWAHGQKCDIFAGDSGVRRRGTVLLVLRLLLNMLKNEVDMIMFESRAVDLYLSRFNGL